MTSRVAIVCNVYWEQGTAHHGISAPTGQRLLRWPQDPEAEEGGASPGPQLEPYLDPTQNYSAFKLLMSGECLMSGRVA